VISIRLLSIFLIAGAGFMPAPALAQPDQGSYSLCDSRSAGTITYEEAVEKYADPDSRFAVLEGEDGISLHYKDEGSGPAILLVHGSSGDLKDWNGWVKVLKENYRVVRLELPGFGLTGQVPSGNYSVDRYLGLVDALMGELGIDRFAIAGVSYGGLVAFRYAGTRTDRVTALVLMNSAGIQFGRRRSAEELLLDRTRDFTPRVMERESLESVLKDLINDPAKVTPELVTRKTDYWNVVGRDCEGYVANRLYERGNPLRVLGDVLAPSLVLWGGANKALSPSTVEAFVDALENASVVEKIVYEGGGHLLNIERPLETGKDVKAFLDRHLAHQRTGASADTKAKAAIEATVGTPGNSKFWQDSMGWWVSDNTYLDGQLQPKIPLYQSIVHIEAQAGQVLETTYKFYPPGDLSQSVSGGRVGDDQGVEFITVSTMQAIAGAEAMETISVSPASMSQSGRMVTTALSSTVALQQRLQGEVGLADYQIIINLPTPDRRYTTVFGLYTGLENEEVAPGDLRGLSLFASKRITADEVQELRSKFRILNSVGAIVSGDAQGQTVVEMVH
jgi:pimeloyl-ACP methyl ester carboxylesterase